MHDNASPLVGRHISVESVDVGKCGMCGTAGPNLGKLYLNRVFTLVLPICCPVNILTMVTFFYFPPTG